MVPAIANMDNITANRKARTLAPPPQQRAFKHQISLQESNQTQTQTTQRVHDCVETVSNKPILKVNDNKTDGRNRKAPTLIQGIGVFLRPDPSPIESSHQTIRESEATTLRQTNPESQQSDTYCNQTSGRQPLRSASGRHLHHSGSGGAINGFCLEPCCQTFAIA